VPTMRLELIRLSPLPPQDSVSTNFTTSALSATPDNKLTARRTHSVYGPRSRLAGGAAIDRRYGITAAAS
jgi:hypothetical protein